jgi:hypothetical protein
MCVDAGFVVPIPRTEDHPSIQSCTDRGVAEPWVAQTAPLLFDDAAWEEAGQRGYVAACSALSY